MPLIFVSPPYNSRACDWTSGAYFEVTSLHPGITTSKALSSLRSVCCLPSSHLSPTMTTGHSAPVLPAGRHSADSAPAIASVDDRGPTSCSSHPSPAQLGPRPTQRQGLWRPNICIISLWIIATTRTRWRSLTRPECTSIVAAYLSISSFPARLLRQTSALSSSGLTSMK